MKKKMSSQLPNKLSENKPKEAIQLNQESVQEKNNTIFNVGIIVEDTDSENIEYYNEQFKQINDIFGDKVKLIFFGYKLDEDKYNILKGVSYNYHPNVSIIHNYKQFSHFNFNLIFIPRMNNVGNGTSEPENPPKFMEAAEHNIPVITVDMYPYNKHITHNLNGFLYKSRETFIDFLKVLLQTNSLPLIKLCGQHANEYCKKNLDFSGGNIKSVSNVFSVAAPKT